MTLPAGASHLDNWSAATGEDAAVVRRLNPAFSNGRIAPSNQPLQVLAPAVGDAIAAASDAAPIASAPERPGAIADASQPNPSVRTHVVGRGESLWTIARHYKLQVADLLSRNALESRSVLRPGMVLRLDAGAATSEGGGE